MFSCYIVKATRGEQRPFIRDHAFVQEVTYLVVRIAVCGFLCHALFELHAIINHGVEVMFLARTFFGSWS